MKKRNQESGIALLTTLMLLGVFTALFAAFSTTVITDQRMRTSDEVQTQSFYAAHGALEQMTADVGNLFATNFAPTNADLLAIEVPPVLPGVTYVAPGGGNGYDIQPVQVDVNGDPVATVQQIVSGPFQGFTALATPYNLSVVARTNDTAELGAETWLRRQMQTVAIPVFQFGIFSETDLSFFAGPNFNFGGRVHSNGNLFLTSGNSSTLMLGDRVTAVGEVIRTHLSNGETTVNRNGPVRIIDTPGSTRPLAKTEGSLVNTLGSAQNEPTWTNVSLGAYNGHLRNGRTGARNLQLPFVSLGATPVDLIKRGIPGENVFIRDQRYFMLASLRILLSDTAADLTGLPTVTATAPVPLTNLAAVAAMGGGGALDPLPLSDGDTLVGGDDIYRSAQDTPLLGGFIKIELQTPGNVWQDVTIEILNLGITGDNQFNGACADPSPNAVIRLQRVRNAPANNAPCGIGSNSPYDYWPQALYDAREGNLRDNQGSTSTNIFLGGVMHYVELDANNLRRWLQGAIGASGPNARSVNGYTVYFSDRRGNRDAANNETGEYGFEDFVNPGSPTGTPNGVLDTGEDLNSNGVLEVYGQFPSADGLANTNLPGAEVPLTTAARPWTNISDTTGFPEPNAQRPRGRDTGMANRAILFRRALKLVNGGLGNLPGPGLTVASENPVYIQGNWNANNAGFGDPHVATAAIADSVSFLSNSWNDYTSFLRPNNVSGTGRIATTTWYRVAVLGGKGPSFPRPAAGGPPEDYGTDGGVHNFLRMVERWSGRTLNYRGSMASFYFNRQGIGTYKCCSNVYSPPTRAFVFDTDFLDPALLPPFTPMFRDINTTGFSQVIR